MSDQERQAVVDRLSWATGEGMLTLEEFAETSASAYAAVTRADLAAVGAELHLPIALMGPPVGTPPSHTATVPPPAPTATPPTAGHLPHQAPTQAAPALPPQGQAQPQPQASTRPAASWVVAVMSSEDRRGRWRVGRNLGAFALMGGIDLDLRDAVLESDVVEITAWAIMGGVTITVPEGIPVETSGFMLMGGRTTRIKDVPPLPGAPTIKVIGYGLWGGVTVRSKGPRKERTRKDRQALVGDIVDDALDVAHDALDIAAGHVDAHRRDHRGRARDHGRQRDQGRARDQGRGRRPPDGPTPPGVPTTPGGPVPPAVPTPPRPPGRRWDDDALAASPAAPRPTQKPSSGLVTIVSTDIVGSTRRASELGDQVWHSVLLAHNAVVRHELARYGGYEVKTSGDGFLVTFTSARAAVQFSLAVQEALREQGRTVPELALDVRIGVHAGEVEHDGTDVIGRNVTIACRLCDAATPGEVLASGMVADLADSASDLSFGPAREHQLAGIDRPLVARPALRR